jgi:hypothetical protein
MVRGVLIIKPFCLLVFFSFVSLWICDFQPCLILSVNDNNKPTGELQYKINYNCKTFYSIGWISFNNIVLLCKIFEHFALQVDPVIGFIQPGSTPFKDSAS